MKRIYVGNLAPAITTNDLNQLFGLSFPSLQNICSVEIKSNKEAGASENFAIINVPEYIYSEIVCLNGIEFYGRELVIEEAKTKLDNNEQDGI